MTLEREFVSFRLEDRLYGLDIRVVKEIHPNVSIVPVPRATSPVRGLVNIRGQVVMVLDIAVLFGTEPRPVTADSHLIILKTAPEIRSVRGLREEIHPAPFGDKPIGFLVDRIGDVVRVPGSQLEPPPPHLDDAHARFVSGVANPGGEFQVILDARELLLAEVETAAADGGM